MVEETGLGTGRAGARNLNDMRVLGEAMRRVRDRRYVDVADALRIDKSTVARCIDRLQENGFSVYMDEPSDAGPMAIRSSETAATVRSKITGVSSPGPGSKGAEVMSDRLNPDRRLTPDEYAVIEELRADRLSPEKLAAIAGDFDADDLLRGLRGKGYAISMTPSRTRYQIDATGPTAIAGDGVPVAAIPVAIAALLFLLLAAVINPEKPAPVDPAAVVAEYGGLPSASEVLSADAAKAECDSDPGCQAALLLAHLGHADLADWTGFATSVEPFAIQPEVAGRGPVGTPPDGRETNDWPIKVVLETSQGAIEIADLDLSYLRPSGEFDYHGEWDAPEGTQQAFLKSVKAGYASALQFVEATPEGESRSSAIRRVLGLKAMSDGDDGK